MNNKTSVLFFLQKGLLQRCIAVAIGLFVISPYLAQAQGEKITFVATTSKKEVTTGGSIQISFKLIGGVGGQLRQPDFGAFTMGRGTSETSGMQIINGEMQGHHTWTFNLVAPAPGDYTIPSATLDIKGKIYTSNAIKIIVVPAGKSQNGQGVTQIPKNADPNVFINTEFSVKSAYPGQQVIVMVYIYTQKNLTGLDMVRLPQPSKGQLNELEKFENLQTQVTVGGKMYSKQAIYAAQYFPEAPGKVDFTAAILNTGINMGGFFGNTRLLTLEAQPVTLDIKPLPQPQPVGFSGLVGSYQVVLDKTTDSIAVGDATVVLMDIRGNGNPRFLSPPGVETPNDIETFAPAIKSEETFENGQEMVHTQSIEYTFSTKQEGLFICTPQLVWFDPDSNKYVQWKMPVELKVGPPKGVISPTKPTGNKPGFSFFNSSKGIGIIALVGAALLLLIYYFITRKKQAHEEIPIKEDIVFEPINTYRQQDFTAPSYQQPTTPVMKPAVSEAEQVAAPLDNSLWAKLELQAQNDGPSNSFYALLFQTLKEKGSQKWGIEPAEMELYHVKRVLEQKGYTADTIEQMNWLWCTCEQVLYAAQDHSNDKVRAVAVAKSLVG